MSDKQLSLVMSQLDTEIGDIEGNTELICGDIQRAHVAFQADVVLFPELCLSGYPARDLLLRPEFLRRVDHALETLCEYTATVSREMHIIVGCPRPSPGGLRNAACWIHQGRVVAEYAKQRLPDDQVFEESRYFVAGSAPPPVFEVCGLRLAVSICEDLWSSEVARQAAAGGAQVLLNINASPYHQGKQRQRFEVARARAQESSLTLVYVNQCGAQDELVFDGGSFVCDSSGRLLARAPNHATGLCPVQLSAKCLASDQKAPAVIVGKGSIVPELGELDELWLTLKAGLAGYLRKNGFSQVVLGLSGGIDSALCLALAVDALGPDAVHAVMMPSQHTARMSLEDSAEQARALGVDYRVIPITGVYDAFCATLGVADSRTGEAELVDASDSDFFGQGEAIDLMKQNLQARCRGVLLMALSNQHGWMTLATGNKSEYSVGYATLYGDMAGGFAPLKDVPKILIYDLAKHINERRLVSGIEAIPHRVIERPPSAELSPNQRDSDNIPPYETLDPILRRYVELDQDLDEILAVSDPDAAQAAIGLVVKSEHKRAQAPPGTRISHRGFGHDWRYPIAYVWPWRRSPLPAFRWSKPPPEEGQFKFDESG